MLKFGQYELEWSDVVGAQITNEDTNEVSVFTADNLCLVVGAYPFASDAATIKNLIDNGKAGNAIGGIGTTVIIDDL